MWKVGDGGAKEVTIVECSGKKRRPSRGRVCAGEAAIAAVSGGKAARKQYRRQQAAKRVGFTARIWGSGIYCAGQELGERARVSARQATRVRRESVNRRREKKQNARGRD